MKNEVLREHLHACKINH